jgi:DNA-binding winged helix-turn-helix (wHTH) protein
MREETSLCFGAFRLDVANESVWHGKKACKLTRKALAVLRYLVEHAGQLVTKETLFKRVWPEVVVGDAALTVCIRALRQVLGDNAKAPQYIETVYGRGYRFIGKVVSSQESVVSSPSSSLAPSTQPLAPALVGRETELWQLHEWLEKAQGGQRQIVFVTGEPGIGKTTLIEAFLMGVRDWGG